MRTLTHLSGISFLCRVLAQLRGLIRPPGNSLEEMLANYSRFIDVLPSAVFELDVHGTVVFANDAAIQLFGGLRPPFRLSGVVPAEEMDRLNGVLKEVFSGAPLRSAGLKLAFDGRTSVLELHAARILKDGACGGCLCVLTETDGYGTLREELERTRQEAEWTTAELNRKITDLEEFALMAVRRELKMREIRERFVRLSQDAVQPAPDAEKGLN